MTSPTKKKPKKKPKKTETKTQEGVKVSKDTRKSSVSVSASRSGGPTLGNSAQLQGSWPAGTWSQLVGTGTDPAYKVGL